MNADQLTLTTKLGVTFLVGTSGGKASFIYSPLYVRIIYRHDMKRYVVMQLNQVIMSDISAAVCLEKIAEAILDRHAEDIVPSFMCIEEADLDMAAE